MRLLLAASVVVAVVAARPQFVAAGLQTGLSLLAQDFEVASVKPNKSGDMATSFRLQPGGRLNALNVPLRDLIRFAYAVLPFQVEGDPAWAESERFDVLAKVAGEIQPTPPGQVGPVHLMLQNLLAERFALKVRRETKDMPAYALVMARPDRQLGKQLTASTVDCAALLRAQLAAGRAGPPTGPGGPVCRLSTGGPGTVMARDVSIQQLAQLLSGQVQRQVIDETGLSGGFSFDLSYATDQASDLDRPSLFTAVQEQLGLKLESRRAPLEMLIVENVQPPTPD